MRYKQRLTFLNCQDLTAKIHHDDLFLSAIQHDDHDARRTITHNRSPRTTSRTTQEIVGAASLLFNPDELLVYECDGFVVEKKSPDVVVFPTTTEQVVAIVKLCNEFDVPFVPRGAGTSLAGGCLPVGGGVMITLTRMKRILEINYRDRYAIVEPGLVNVHLTQQLKGSGYHYAPDPSSQGAARSVGILRPTRAVRIR